MTVSISRTFRGSSIVTVLAVVLHVGCSEPPVAPPEEEEEFLVFESVSVAAYYSCGMTAEGAACWGGNGAGNLGNGSTTTRSTPVMVGGEGPNLSTVVAGGNGFTCGLTTTGSALCWGARADGVNLTTRLPVPVPGNHQFTLIDIGGGSGPSHACGLTTSGAAYCWGNVMYGQLGDGNFDNLADCGSGWYCKWTPVLVQGNHTFKSLAAGEFHTCGLTASGSVYCWGNNDYGQLGEETSEPWSTVPLLVRGGITFSWITAGGSRTCGLDTSGKAYCWGANGGDGAMGNGSSAAFDTPQPVTGDLSFTALSTGATHTCGIQSEGTAFCWGSNEKGELGVGTTIIRQRTPTVAASGLKFSQITAGYYHTCGITIEQLAVCWGRNDYGQLGDATQTDRALPVKVGGQR
jgi:alpha-tubulin suppressor-like RCC1 family protein